MSEVIADSERLIIRTWREADRADYLGDLQHGRGDDISRWPGERRRHRCRD